MKMNELLCQPLDRKRYWDTAVAVHPNDERYSHLRRKNTMLWHPFRDEALPLIFDESVNPSLGTGAVKITPAHSKIDYDIAQRHNLPIIDVIDVDGRIKDSFENYAKLPRFLAREKILNDLSDMNLFVSKANHSLELPICSRSKDVIELMIKQQWFLDCKRMSEVAIDVVNTGRLKIEPERFENIWKTWLETPMDWCLSRQLWWGHRIPAYQCEFADQAKWFAAHSQEAALDKAVAFFKTERRNIEIRQDDDVLDTWFSSGILPFSLLGWPKNDKLDNFPLDLLVSGHDILFFWIARMVMLSTHIMNDVPFRKVLLHGIICDEKGKKMSKSLGNVVTPDQVINGTTLDELKSSLKKLHKYGIISNKELQKSLLNKQITFPKGIPHCGVDALRLTLCFTDVQEHFIKFNVDQCERSHRFLNKIWIATKFTLSNCDTFSVEADAHPIIDKKHLSEMDKWILSRLADTVIETSKSLDDMNVGCAHRWHEFFYENLCDVYIEASKVNFQQNRSIESQTQCEVLKTCLTIGLRHIGIFTPFISNELLNYLPNQMSFEPHEWINHSVDSEMKQVLEICAEIRGIKSVQQILKKHGPRNYLFSTNSQTVETLNKFKETINQLTFSTGTSIHATPFDDPQKFLLSSIVNDLCAFGITTDAEVQLIDIHERNRKKLDRLALQLKELSDKMSTDKYQKKAKNHRKEIDRLKVEEIETKMKAVAEIMQKYSNTK